MNSVNLVGRLTSDPDVRYTNAASGQMAVVRYTLAIDRRRAATDGQRQTDFINIVAFGRGGEFAEKYFHKGMRVAVHGRIQTGSYTNKNGQKVYTTDIIVDEQEFADGKQAGNTAPSSTAASGQTYNEGFEGVGEGFMNIPDGIEDEGLPFN